MLGIFTVKKHAELMILMIQLLGTSTAYENSHWGTYLLTAWEYHGALGLFLPGISSSSPRPVREGRLRDPLGVPNVGGG